MPNQREQQAIEQAVAAGTTWRNRPVRVRIAVIALVIAAWWLLIFLAAAGFVAWAHVPTVRATVIAVLYGIWTSVFLVRMSTARQLRPVNARRRWAGIRRPRGGPRAPVRIPRGCGRCRALQQVVRDRRRLVSTTTVRPSPVGSDGPL